MVDDDFHEVWWIFSTADADWAGLRIAHFRHAAGGELIVVIDNELPARMGPRIWLDIQRREQWHKVARIAIPSPDQVRAAVTVQ